MTLPKSVTRAASVVGGYLGIEHAFFDAQGVELDDDGPSPPETAYLVVDSYYGSAVFGVEGGRITRLPNTDD